MKIKDPIMELKATQLYLHLLSLDREYADRIVSFVSAIAPLMATIKNYFPFYTRHDAHHGYQVVNRISQCLLPSCFDSTKPEALTAQEIFLLIAAAYAHDLGMAIFPEEEEKLLAKLGISLSSDWKNNESLQRYLRDNHSKRGGEYIDQNAEKLKVPRNLVAALDLLMKAHNYSIPELERELQRPFAAGQKESDLTQLALIVCVADAIEFSDTRVIDGVLDRLSADKSYAGKISYAENMKHVCTGDSLAVNQEGRIIVSGSFADSNVLALAHHTFDQMEEWIQGYSDIDHRCKQRRLKVRGEPFLRDFIFSGGNFQRLGVRLNQKSVIDLISSNAIWRTHQGIALRELIQNSVEACRYRAHHSAPSDKYLPKIRIVFNRDIHSVTISDNGCGMSERTVLNNLLTVGSSRSREAAYTESDYSPIARFGIGFWSVFTISDLATVSTAAFEPYRGKPHEAVRASGFEFSVQLTELKDFTVFSPVEMPCGTSIILKLKPDIVIDDIYMGVKAQLLCSMVPLSLILDGNEEHFDSEIPDVNSEILHGVRRTRAESLGIKVFQYRGKTVNTSLTFGLAYNTAEGRISFMAEPNVPMLGVTAGFHTQRTAVCGFSVPLQHSLLCIDLPRVGTYYANALSPKGFEFSIDRQQLNKNTAATQYMEDVQTIFHEGYRLFLKQTGSYRPEVIHALQGESTISGGNVYDTFTESELADAKAKFEDLICGKLIPVSPIHSLDTSEMHAKYLNLNDLSKENGIAYCLQAQLNPFRYGPTMFLDLESRQALQIAYTIAQSYVKKDKPDVPVYLMQPDRIFSMLFDNDSSSSAKVHTLSNGLDISMLKVNLATVNYHDKPHNVVPDINGQWSGAVYWREFETLNNKPYLFLGRHRVLIKPNTQVHLHLKNLFDEKRFAAIAQFINLLREDEAGHTATSLLGLMK